MNELIEILENLHPEVDFETCTTLIDDKILDSFDIISIISEINETFDVVIPAEEIIPEKPWALTGTGCKRFHNVVNSLYLKPDELEVWFHI